MSIHPAPAGHDCSAVHNSVILHRHRKLQVRAKEKIEGDGGGERGRREVWIRV